MKHDRNIQDPAVRPEDRLRRLEEARAPMRFDLNTEEGIKVAEDALDALFDARTAGIGKQAELPDGDSAYLVMKRRKQAILRLIPTAEQRWGERFPALAVGDAFARLNAPSAAPEPTALNREWYVDYAAALWMLDTLRATEPEEQAAALLPRERAALDAVSLPLMTDAVYTDDALRAVLAVIRGRSGGVSDAICVASDTGLTRGDGGEVPPGRERFAALMSLIPAEARAAAEANFTACLWAIAESAMTVLHREEAALAAECSALRTELTARSLCAAVPEGGAPLPTPQDIRLEARVRAALEQANDADLLYASLPAQLQAVSGVSLPAVTRPYEVCFGFLSLLERDSDLVWLLPLCGGALDCACRALPWAAAPDTGEDETRIDWEYLRALADRTPDWDSRELNERWYTPLIPSPFEGERDRRMSIAQLSFLISSVIPPRSVDSIAFTRALLNAAGLVQEEQDALYEYLSLAYALSERGDALDDESLPDAEDEAAPDGDAAELMRLRGESKRLKEMIRQHQRDKRELSARLTESEEKLAAAEQELDELRAMLHPSDDTGEEAASAVVFPYTVRRRTVIIGGHDSWLKAIRPLLREVRYIAASEQPNPALIRGAEVVWIQSNALGHSSYYKIIDIIRRSETKVCYFQYASAEKCAEQLAREDADHVTAETKEEV